MQAKIIFIAAGVISTLSMAAIHAHAAPVSAQDFVTKASIANKFEIDSSKLALEKSQNSAVRNFAQTMIDDHEKTGEKLKETLENSDSGAEPASELDDKHQNLLNKLESISGTAFDTNYITMQTDAHKEAVSLFSNYARNGKDTALKNFAAKTLPALQSHLKHVQQIKRAH